MKASSKALFGALAAAGILLFLVWRFLKSSPASQTLGTAIGEASAEGPRRESSELAAERDPARRVSQADATPAPAANDVASPKPLLIRASFRVQGRTLDIRGSPVPGVHVGTREAGRALGRSDALGFFGFDLAEPGHKLVAFDEEWVTVRYDLVRAGGREHFLIVAPPLSLGGKVVDPSARPLDGASVQVEIPIAAFAGFPLALDSTGLERFATKSGPDGRFALERAPALSRAQLVTSYPSLETDRRPLPSESASDLTIELKAPSERGTFLDGIVVHADEKPAAGARVLLARQETTADGEGRFRLALEKTDPESPLVAVLEGFQPAVVLEYGRVIEATDGHPTPARLVLGPPPLSIAGRVLDADGEPAPKWTVTLLEGTVVTPYQIPVITVEKLTASGEQRAVAGDDGSFRIGGLRNIPYRLQAWNHEGSMIRSQPIPAGTEDAVLRADPDAFVERISGRVLSRDGLPLPDLDVEITVVTERTAYGNSFTTVKRTATGKDGSFEIVRVPRRFASLSVGGESVQSKNFELDEVDLERPIEVVVARTCRFRFECEPGADAPTGMAVLDAQGQGLNLVTKEAGSMSGRGWMPLSDGRSHVLSVSEDAARLVLYQGDEVLSSQPLRLVPGDVAVVRRQP